MESDSYYSAIIAQYLPVLRHFAFLLKDTEPERQTFEKRFLMKIDSSLHGIDHWARVGIYGLAIAETLWTQKRVTLPCFREKQSFENAVIFSAFFHDSARITEDCEFDHGRAAEKIWRHYADRKGFEEELKAAISLAILYHVDYPSIVSSANEVAICLCNADRLDRVRLDQDPDPKQMYDDGIWIRLHEHADRLLEEIDHQKVKTDIDEMISGGGLGGGTHL